MGTRFYRPSNWEKTGVIMKNKVNKELEALRAKIQGNITVWEAYDKLGDCDLIKGHYVLCTKYPESDVNMVFAYIGGFNV